MFEKTPPETSRVLLALVEIWLVTAPPIYTPIYPPPLVEVMVPLPWAIMLAPPCPKIRSTPVFMKPPALVTVLFADPYSWIPLDWVKVAPPLTEKRFVVGEFPYRVV